MTYKYQKFVAVTLALLCTIVAVQETMAAPDAPLIYWNFDGPSQSIAKDLSGNGLNGRVGARWTRSPSGRAVMMDGEPKSTVAVNIPLDKRFGKKSWTFMAMVKPIKFGIDSEQNQRRIFAFGKYPDAFMIISIAGNGQVSGYICYKNSVGKIIAAGGSSDILLTENQWAHIAIVCDREEKIIKTYINGYCKAGNKMPKAFDGDFVLDGRMTVGSTWQNYWGLIDEVKITRTAVAPHEVAAESERLKSKFKTIESEEIIAAKKRLRQERSFTDISDEYAKGRYDNARSLCREIVDSSDAPAHFRSYAHLWIARSYLPEKKLSSAKTTYLSIAQNKSYPIVHRDEAEMSASQLGVVSSNSASRNSISTQTDVSVIPRFAAEVFVSTNGKDTNSGSMPRPLATLSRARDKVRALKRSGVKGPIAVTIMPGRYKVNRTLTLNREDSGSASSPVVYRAKEKGTVVFYGGQHLSGFKPVTDKSISQRLPAQARDKVLQCSLKALGIYNYGSLKVRGFGQPPSPPTLELFVDRVPMTLARWPNKGFVGIDKLIKPGSKSKGSPSVFRYRSNRHQRWINADDGWLFGYFHYLWSDATIRIGKIDPSTKTLTTAQPYHYGGSGMSTEQGIQYYAFNLLEEIDTPGEWYLDRKTGMLYLYPPSDPDKSTIEIGMLSRPMIAMDRVSHIRMEGLEFDLARYNAIEAKNCSNFSMVGCTVSRMAGNGIMIHGGRKNQLIGCEIHTIGRRAVEVIGGDRRTLTPGSHLVENCRIHNFGRIDRTYTPAIHLEGVGHRIAHNLMYDGPSTAVRVGGNDHLIEYNEIHSMVQESDDQGAIDLYRNPTYRGVVFRHNYLHHIGKSGTETSVHGQAAIRFDDAISGMQVYGNVFYRCGKGNFGAIQMNGGRDNLIDNNLFIECKLGISGGWRPNNSIWIGLRRGKNFTDFYQNRLYLSRYPKIATMLDSTATNHLWRNVFYKCGTVARSTENMDMFQNKVFDENPGFVDAKNGDFRIRSDAELFRTMCFKTIPFDQIGLYETPSMQK